MNAKLLAAAAFPVVLLPIDVSALAGSAVESVDVVLSVSIAIVLIGGTAAFLLWRMSRGKQVLARPSPGRAEACPEAFGPT